MNKIVCFHLYNDFSGSPKVLKTVLEGLLKMNRHIDIVSSKGGVLESLEHYQNLRCYWYRYHFSERPFLTMLRYTLIQIYTFLFSFRYLFTKNIVFYINTLLPIGPAVAGRLMGKRVVYHYHENAFVKGFVYRFLAKVMQYLAHQIICVSYFQASMLDNKSKIVVIPNALSEDFRINLSPNPDNAFKKKTVLMISSLKKYKGISEFISLSSQLSQFHFTLLINDEIENIRIYLEREALTIPDNLCLLQRQEDVSSMYGESSVLLNLTNKEYAIETFGLTTLEALTVGLPVIVPTIGGIAEMVEDGVNGYKIDVTDLDKISETLIKMLTDIDLYRYLAINAITTSGKYREKEMIKSIVSLIENVERRK